MEYFIFELENGRLEVTVSDQETTQISIIDVESMSESGSVAVPSRIILEVLKEFSDQMITFESNDSSFEINLSWESGNINLPGQSICGYPDVKKKNSDTLNRIAIDSNKLYDLINTTLFATSDKDNRVTMMGVFFDIAPESTTVVATDGFKLVKIALPDSNTVTEHTSFIIPKRPAINLKTLLQKENEKVEIEFDNKNIHFTIGDNTFICRTIEGRYPNYNSVIPQNNTNTIIVDRVALLSSIKKVSICSDKSNDLVKIQVIGQKMILQARDINFYVAAEDSLVCNHNGNDITIGFKFKHLIDMLTAFSSENIEMQFSDSTRAGLFVPVDSDNECEQNSVILLMPITLN